MMFTAPPEQTLEWADSGVDGSARFLKRLWAFAHEFSKTETKSAAALQGAALPEGLAAARREVHAVLKQANYDMARHQFNTVAWASMKILNALETAHKSGADPALRCAVLHEGLSILLRLLSPITPHVSHHLWQKLGLVPMFWPNPGRSPAQMR